VGGRPRGGDENPVKTTGGAAKTTAPAGKTAAGGADAATGSAAIAVLSIDAGAAPCRSASEQPGIGQQADCIDVADSFPSEQQGRRSGIPDAERTASPSTTIAVRFSTGPS